ncbi:protein kinase domain-containing protein [Streptomyces sp. NPDC001935]
MASVRALGAGLAEALEAIHAAGLIHRDLKPSNVLIASDGPRVVDFGISVAAEATVLTRTGTAVGTPGFMSPEQLTGDPVTPATDVFALGAVLTYASTGVGPFGTGSAQSLNFRIAYEEPRLDGLPEGLEIVARCLAKDPEQRPDVARLIGELADMASDLGYTPTEIVSDAVVWLPEQVAAAVAATVTSAVPAPSAPARAAPGPVVPPKHRKAVASPPRNRPARSKPTADRRAAAAAAVAAESPNRPAAGEPSTWPPTATKASSSRPTVARQAQASATPVAPAALPHVWTVRRVLFLSVACIAFVLSLCLPFTYRASVFAFLFSDWWPWWSSDWPFVGTWPFVLAAGLAITSCAVVLAKLRRFPTGPVPPLVRRLHYLTATLAWGLLALHVTLGLAARGDLSFLEFGSWFFVLGCAALVASTFRLSGPKSAPAPTPAP